MKVTLFHLQEAGCRDYEVFELGLTLKLNLLLEGKRNAIKLHQTLTVCNLTEISLKEFSEKSETDAYLKLDKSLSPVEVCFE